MQKITPFLWFDNNAEEAIKLYTSIFKDSKVINESRYGKGGPGPEGMMMSAVFQIEGQQFMVLNGGPMFKFTEAISLFVNCTSQEEIDMYWEKLIADGGSPSMCGWLKDKYGLSWQIIPSVLSSLIGGKDPAGSQRAMQAMLKMGKLDIKTLQDAYNNK